MRKSDQRKSSAAEKVQAPSPATAMVEGAGSSCVSKPPGDLGESDPRQPTIGPFPSDNDGRQFQPDWYKRFEWLEYSVERNAVFCYSCRKYGRPAGNARTLRKFTVEGYCKWKHALGDSKKGLLLHNSSSVHCNAMATWKQKQIRLETNSSVSILVSNDILEKRRYYVRSIAEIVQFLAINELSFRGSYNKVLHDEQGLFMKLFNYTMKKDAKLSQIVKEIPQNATLRSGVVQNNAIDLMAKMVSEQVANEIKNSDAGKFTLLADGTRNKARVENIACAVRYVREGMPKEHLLAVKSTELLNANALTDVLLQTLNERGIDGTNIVSQCYDGAACMSGKHGGVQKLLQDRLGRKIPYIHCKNHKLHLVVVDLVSGTAELSQFFSELDVLYNFFAKFKVDKIYEGTKLKRVITTRWSGHYDATMAVVENYKEIVCALQEVTDNSAASTFDADTVAMAIGLGRILKRNMFQFCAVLMKKVLGILKPADACLQMRETDINESIQLINTSIKVIQSMRSDKEYDALLREVNTLRDEVVSEEVVEAGTEALPRPKRQCTTQRRLTDFLVTEKIPVASAMEETDSKKALMFAVIDRIVSEMKLRFADSSWLYTAICALSRNNKKFLDRESLLPLHTQLDIDIPSDAELQVAKQFLQDHVPLAEHQDSIVVLKELYKQRLALPHVYKLAAIVASFGSSSAVCESGFSVLSSIDKPARRCMLETRQANLVLLAFEKELTEKIDLNIFIKRFSEIHPRLLLQ